MQTIRPNNLKSVIPFKMFTKKPPMIWGSPGIGKSEIVAQVAQSSDIPVLDFRANLFDPVDVRGVPFLAQYESARKYTSWAVPDVFPISERDGDRGILFIDELTTAPPSTQNAFLQLILDRRVGNYELPHGWGIVAAGNRLTDGAAVYQMPSALRDRFTHFILEPVLDEWVTWAYQNQVNPDVIAFINYRPNLLSGYNPDEYAFPTPRSWVAVSDTLNSNKTLSSELLYTVTAGTVGEGPAGEFVAFKEIANKLPDIDNLISNPHTFKRDDNPAVLYALCTAIATRASQITIGNIMKITNKLDKEFQVIVIKGCISKDKSLRTHQDVRKWISDNASVVLS